MTTPEQEPEHGGDGCFLILWAYLMILSIALAPVVSALIRGKP